MSAPGNEALYSDVATKTEVQKSFARAGHAHAGVFVVFALAAQILADTADLDGVANFLVRNGI